MQDNKRVYVDNAATTPIDERVLGVILPHLINDYGNASSLHKEGRDARRFIDKSRAEIADLIESKKDEIIFTSGGTEADSLAILGIARASKSNGSHIVTSVIEHKAILDACKRLESEGFEITYVGVDSDGLVSVDDIESALREDTILVSIMAANNEIGSLQPIAKISKAIKQSVAKNAVFHTDACQATNYLELNVDDLGIDAMTLSSSKIYGPKGVGCLYLRDGVKIQPIVFGGGQEKGIRSGTENIALIVGFAEAMKIVNEVRSIEKDRLKDLRNYLLSEIEQKIDGITVNGGMIDRLPNNLNISIKGVEGESLLLMLDQFGIAVSTGSACSSSDLNPSHVLLAINTPIELAHCSVRFSLGRFTNRDDIDYIVKSLVESVEKIRGLSVIKS